MVKTRNLKKHLKVFNDKDRISKLPDDLIGNILSRLITADAVATSILSKDWKDKWLHIYHIDIDCHAYNDLPRKLPSLINSLEKLFQYGMNVRTIYFKSSRDHFTGNLSVLGSLISGFLKYKSEILHIDTGDEENDGREIVVPGWLLSSETLREMVLRYSSFKVPSKICFPHLKTLCLEGLGVSRGEVEPSNEIDNTMTLKFTFPVLETLEICCCVFQQVKLVEIYSPCLQRIVSYTNFDLWEGFIGHEIKIFGATGPVRYESVGDYLDNIVFSSGSNIISATISSDFELDEIKVKNLMIELYSTLVDLTLSFDCFKVFAKILLEEKHGFHPPTFKKLERLFLTCDGNWNSLFEILHASPYLKFLGIEMDTSMREVFNYDVMESIPSYLMSTLEELEIHFDLHFRFEEKAKFGFLKFLLQIGAKAELRSFHCNIKVTYETHSDNVMKQISSLPRAPPHFTLCTKNLWNRRKNYFCYRESSGWVENVECLVVDSECSSDEECSSE